MVLDLNKDELKKWADIAKDPRSTQMERDLAISNLYVSVHRWYGAYEGCSEACGLMLATLKTAWRAAYGVELDAEPVAP